MILVHSIKGEPMYINPNMIETIRSTPDTVLFLSTDKRVTVTDSAEEIVERIVEYQRRITGRKYMDVKELAESMAAGSDGNQ